MIRAIIIPNASPPAFLLLAETNEPLVTRAMHKQEKKNKKCSAMPRGHCAELIFNKLCKVEREIALRNYGA